MIIIPLAAGFLLGLYAPDILRTLYRTWRPRYEPKDVGGACYHCNRRKSAHRRIP